MFLVFLSNSLLQNICSIDLQNNHYSARRQLVSEHQHLPGRLFHQFLMAGRGRGRRGQVPDEEVPYRDRNVQDVLVEDLQRQVAELTQRLVAQDFGNVEGHESDSSFENPYHHRVRGREHRGREDRHGDFGFRVDLP